MLHRRLYIILFRTRFVTTISKFVKTKKLFKKIVIVVFNNFLSFTMSKVTKLKLKI